MEVGQAAGPRAKTAHPALRRLADARAFGDAVTTHGNRMAGAKTIGPKDLLRLRALLTAIAIAGFSEATTKPTAVQVLPTAANGAAETWPRLMGRALQVVFGGREPAVRRLQMDPVHDRLPTDVLETWATCTWAGEIALEASRRVPALTGLAPFLERLVGQMALLVALLPEERSSRDFVAVLQALDERFRERLGLSPVHEAPYRRGILIEARGRRSASRGDRSGNRHTELQRGLRHQSIGKTGR